MLLFEKSTNYNNEIYQKHILLKKYIFLTIQETSFMLNRLPDIIINNEKQFFKSEIRFIFLFVLM